jgi:hypothetical protein
MNSNYKKILLTGIAVVAIFGTVIILLSILERPTSKKITGVGTETSRGDTENAMEKSLIHTDNILDTSAWKEFRSETTNIVFKYPANWYINESAFKNTLPDQPLKQITLGNYDQDKVNGSDTMLPPQFIKITILSFTDTGDLTKWSKKLGFSKPETLKINGATALRDKHVYRGPDQSQNNPRFYGEVTILLNDKVGYELSYGPNNSELANIYELIANSVSFK